MPADPSPPASQPLTISMHPNDNVAIVANDGGLPAGTVLSTGLVLKDKVPQGHKVALVDLPMNAPVLRYGIPIGSKIHQRHFVALWHFVFQHQAGR